MAQSDKSFYWKILLLLPVPLLWGWFAQNGYLDSFERLFLNLRYRARGELSAPVKVFYVDFDSKALKKIGDRPWNRARFGEAAKLLMEQGGAKGLGFDFVFSSLSYSELVNPEDATKGNFALARVAKAHPQVVLAAKYTYRIDEGVATTSRKYPLIRLGLTNRQQNDVPELPQYPMVNPSWSASIGLIDFDYELGGDQTPRWAPLFAETIGPTFWHMGVQLACIELGVPPGSARRAGDFVEIVHPNGRVLRRIPVHAEQLLEVNWFTEWNSTEIDLHASLADVLLAGDWLRSDDADKHAKAEAYFKRFRGTIILIGPTDELFQDTASTPFDSEPVPKVSAHGNLLKTIISEYYLVRSPPWVLWVSVIGLTVTVTLLTVSGGARSVITKFLGLILLVGFMMLGLYVFARANYILPMTAPIGAAFTTGFIATLWQVVQEEKNKGRIKGMFSTYLAPELVNQMVESKTDPKLGGHNEVITGYFSDIQRFSTFSELMTPEKLVELMNEYLTACTDIIQEEKGTLDKYIGDAVVAIFGAPLPVPNHAYRACVATQRVQHRIGELREKWRSEGDKWHPVVYNLRARLGLNTGPAIIGNMGSRSRFSYTMMGDNVNLAARMESGAKSLGAFTMVTEATKLECEKHGGDHVVFRYLDRIVVKGRSQPVPVFEIVGLKENITQQARDCLGMFAQGVERYLAQDWDGALKIFQQSATLEPNQQSEALAIDSNPSIIFVKRCREMKEHPPGPDWDGVYVMKEK